MSSTWSEVTQVARTASHKSPDNGRRRDVDPDRKRTLAIITGEACDCPEPTAPTTPGVVLDPFGGTGTTALVADVLGRHGISVDLSADYCRLAEWRTTDPKQRAKAARVEAVEPVPDNQLSLFEESA